MIGQNEKNYVARKQLGFTLIEVLFIIVIVGILASIMLLSYQQSTNTLKVQKTALQMQQLLQAGVSYKNDWDCWPNSDPRKMHCKVGFPDFTTYAPIIPLTRNRVMINPWGGAYRYYPSDASQKGFTVDSGELAKDQSIANRIASLLPNGKPDLIRSPPIVTATITLSGRNSYNYPGEVIFKTIGSTQPLANTHQVTIPQIICPPGFKAQAAVMLQQIATFNYKPATDDAFERLKCPVGTGPIGILDPQLSPCDNGNCLGRLKFTSVIPDPDAGNSTYFCQNPDHSPMQVTDPGRVTYAYMGWCAPASSSS